MRVQFRWPVGMPLCRSLGQGLWEVRSDLTSNRIARVLMFHWRAHRRAAWLYQEGAKGAAGRLGAGVEAQARIRTRRGVSMTKIPRSSSDFLTLDEHLDTEGTCEDFQAVAIKEVLAWQIEQAMKAQKLSRKRLAERMGTSRSQVGRLLDPKDGNVTLTTLQRAAAIVGRKVRLDLV
jgi:antitoxin HicB